MASKKVSKKVSAKSKASKAPAAKATPAKKKAGGKGKAAVKKASSAKAAKKTAKKVAKKTSSKPAKKATAAKAPKAKAAKPASKKASSKKTAKKVVAKAKGKKAAADKAPKSSVKKVVAKAAKAVQKSLKGPMKTAEKAVKKAVQKAVKSAKETKKKVAAAVEAISVMPIEAHEGLDVGASAPEFSLHDQEGKTVSSSDLAGKPYVLYFYPKDDTPGCTREACEFRDEHQAFRDAGIAVLGVSPDSSQSHAKFAEKYSLPFRLLSDPDKVLSQAYGAWGKKLNYGREYMGVIRSTFVVGADGLISAAYRGVKVDGHAQKVLSRATGAA